MGAGFCPLSRGPARLVSRLLAGVAAEPLLLTCRNQLAAAACRHCSEEVVLFDNSWIVTIKDRFSEHEHNLAMDLDNVLGLMAWLESAPPGSHYLPGSADSPL